jgi:hypothetical protein
MIYNNYILQSLYVFSLSFVVGVVIDNTFIKLVKQYEKYSIILSLIQLVTIISVSYILHEYHFNYSEMYTPRVLFSSFLLSLQTNMITNFRSILKN